VTAEVTPHHLLLTDAAVIGYDTACKVNPPLREAEDVDAVRAALADGTIDAIATDHAPQTSLEKLSEFGEAKNGIMGLELCFGLLLERVGKDGLTLGRLVDALAAAPARIAGITPPGIRENVQADLVLVDPEKTWVPERETLRSKSRNTPFLKHELKGQVLLTLADGRIVFDRPGGGA
jgi:dihydroorotase